MNSSVTLLLCIGFYLVVMVTFTKADMRCESICLFREKKCKIRIGQESFRKIYKCVKETPGCIKTCEANGRKRMAAEEELLSFI